MQRYGCVRAFYTQWCGFPVGVERDHAFKRNGDRGREFWVHLARVCAVGGFETRTLKGSPIRCEASLGNGDVQEVSWGDVRRIRRSIDEHANGPSSQRLTVVCLYWSSQFHASTHFSAAIELKINQPLRRMDTRKYATAGCVRSQAPTPNLSVYSHKLFAFTKEFIWALWWGLCLKARILLFKHSPFNGADERRVLWKKD